MRGTCKYLWLPNTFAFGANCKFVLLSPATVQGREQLITSPRSNTLNVDCKEQTLQMVPPSYCVVNLYVGMNGFVGKINCVMLLLESRGSMIPVSMHWNRIRLCYSRKDNFSVLSFTGYVNKSDNLSESLFLKCNTSILSCSWWWERGPVFISWPLSVQPRSFSIEMPAQPPGHFGAYFRQRERWVLIFTSSLELERAR